ncbi:MAG: hypothetical protein HYT76_08650 [Deltaproteobacteria bacterium]|nr:hypothetical protein [Deltaproteobacteria bacterium]
MNPLQKLISTMLFLIFFGMQAGCGQVTEETSVSAPITITLPIKSETSLPENLEKVVLEINGEGFPTITQSVSKPFTEGIEFNVDVPIGEDREFKLTVSRTGSLRTGYKGKTVADVTAEGATIPINLQFVNFISDFTAERSGPDISLVSFGVDTQGTSELTDDIVSMKIDFAQSVESSHLAVFIEFDKDNDSSTGRSETIIHLLRGSIATSFKSGSDRYILAEKTSSGYTASLYDSNDAKVDVPESAKLTASLENPTRLVVTLTTAAFSVLVDSNGEGGFNLLVGEKSSLDPLQAPSFSSFTASDIALEEEAIGAAEYDAYFSTSSL